MTFVSPDPEPSSRMGGETQLAPFAMLRVAAVGYGSLLQLAPPRTGAHIKRALAALSAKARVQPLVENLLYAQVPKVTDGKLRGDVLALKRDVHNARTPPPGTADRVRDLLTPPDQAALDTWLSAQEQATAELRASEAALREEIETHVRGGLKRLLRNEVFLRALALASPDLCRQLQGEVQGRPAGIDPLPSDRSLLRYALRAAAKTSPFSSFMHQGAVAVRPGSCEGAWHLERAIRGSRSRLDLGVLAQICRAALLDHANESLPLFRVNSTLRAAGPERIEALAGEYVVFEERTWRTESVGTFQCLPGLVASLVERAGSCVSRAELIDLISAAGVERERAMPFLARLVELSIVWVLPWTDALDPEPAASVAAILQTSISPQIEAVCESVTRMAGIANEFAGIDAWSRIAALARLDETVERARAAAGVKARIGLSEAVREDGFLHGVEGAVGEPLCRQLLEVAELIRQRTEIAPEYVVLRERFLHEFGPGGCCTDVVRFLMDVTRQPEAAAGTPAASAGLGAARERAPRAGITVFLQIAAPDVRAAAGGEGTLVVNQVLDGIGWIAARHAAGERTDQAQLRRWLSRWLLQAMSPREPIDILGRGECSNLQAHPALTRRVLSWPSEPVRAGTEGVVALERCSLVHDESTGYLELRDDQDLPLAPVYLGATLSAGFELMNLLALLSQPFHVPWPRQTQPPLGSEAVVFRPRVEAGRIVLSRATWWVRTRHLHSVWFARQSVRRLLDVAADRETRGIPEIFFAQLHLPAEPDRFAALARKHRKPLWVDTRNPFCLDLLERLAMHGKWILLQEMLPDLAGLWAEMGGEHFVSEVHCEMAYAVQGGSGGERGPS